MIHNQISNQMPGPFPLLKELHFSHNWNNKLNCESFSTVRLRNDNKYQLLDLYRIFLKREVYPQNVDFAIARLQAISHFYLHQVTPGITFLDANLSKIDFIQMIESMYKSKHINFHQQQMSFLVFQYLTPEETKSVIRYD